MYIYSYLFCLYWFKDYCHRVNTQLQYNNNNNNNNNNTLQHMQGNRGTTRQKTLV
jgi:hypothetical protein